MSEPSAATLDAHEWEWKRAPVSNWLEFARGCSSRQTARAAKLEASEEWAQRAVGDQDVTASVY